MGAMGPGRLEPSHVGNKGGFLSQRAPTKSAVQFVALPPASREVWDTHTRPHTHTGKTCGTLPKSRALGGPCSLTARPTTPGRCAPWVAGTIPWEARRCTCARAGHFPCFSLAPRMHSHVMLL
jgi:hypothetical protein